MSKKNVINDAVDYVNEVLSDDEKNQRASQIEEAKAFLEKFKTPEIKAQWDNILKSELVRKDHDSMLRELSRTIEKMPKSNALITKRAQSLLAEATEQINTSKDNITLTREYLESSVYTFKEAVDMVKNAQVKLSESTKVNKRKATSQNAPEPAKWAKYNPKGRVKSEQQKQRVKLGSRPPSPSKSDGDD